MERIALIASEHIISWNALILTLASAVAICVFLAVYLGCAQKVTAAFLASALSVALSIPAARAVHWYCYAESYPDFSTAMTDYSTGGYALVGVFAACILAAVVLRLLRISPNLPQMLDCMSIAGAFGIAVGRLSCLFTGADRGQMVESVRTMPWVYPVVNATSGATEYRLATFLLQAMVAGALGIGLCIFYLAFRRRNQKDGDTALIFLLFYGASQIVLDSTRYDSMYFRSNGFVSVVQVLSLVVLVIAMVVFSVRLVQASGFHKRYLIGWIAQLALLGGAGYMEYHVQRHGNEAVLAYSVMSACLLVAVVLTLLTRFGAARATKTVPADSEETQAHACP